MGMNIFLGGWYLIDEPDAHHGEKARVVSINYDSNYVTMCNYREFEVCKDDLRPIPLTGENFNEVDWEIADTDMGDGAKCYGREMPNGAYLSVWEPKGDIKPLLSIDGPKEYQSITEYEIEYLHELQLVLMACGDDGRVYVPNVLPPWEGHKEEQSQERAKKKKKKKKKHNKNK